MSQLRQLNFLKNIKKRIFLKLLHRIRYDSFPETIHSISLTILIDINAVKIDKRRR